MGENIDWSTQRIFNLFGGKRTLARALNKSSGTLSYWLELGDIPPKYRPAILKIAEGMVVDLGSRPVAAASHSSPTDAAQAPTVTPETPKPSDHPQPTPESKGPAEDILPPELRKFADAFPPPESMPKVTLPSKEPKKALPQRPPCYIGSPVWLWLVSGAHPSLEPEELKAWKLAGGP